MPRRPRITLPGVPLHLIQRGNNRQACFFGDEKEKGVKKRKRGHPLAIPCQKK